MVEHDSEFCGCLYFTSGALSRIMTKMADEAFASTGLSSSYAFLLMAVNSTPGVTPGAISSRMQLSPSTITRLIEKMELKGFLTRKIIGRSTEVYPTKKSLKIDKKIRNSWMSLYHQYTGLLGENSANNLTEKMYQTVKKLES